jgi:hypothetical protein
MMTLKTSLLKAIGLALASALSSLAPAVAMAATTNTPLSRFECLREMLPITDRGSFQIHRKGFEAPFPIGEKYIVFPEVKTAKVTGFFVYDSNHAWYYDTIENAGVRQAIAELQPETSTGILVLTAQPNGLETVSIPYLPSYNPRGTDKHGPVMLGSSVLPVVGAFVSRPQQRDISYFDPTVNTKAELKAWLSAHALSRRSPAGVSEAGEVGRTIVKMLTAHPKSENHAWDPVDMELKIRRDWVQNHNIDEQTFKKISRVIEGCPP